MKTLFAVLALSAAAVPVYAAGTVPVQYPDGYRHWTHVKSMELKPGHALYESFGGLHHIYANPKALKGYQTGKFANGSVIVFDLLEAKTDGNALTEGKRKVLGVMVRDSGKYAATGGWGFEGFAGGDRAKRAAGDNAATACFACHAPQKSTNYLFSTWRD
jgi:hypothetical protein